MKSFLGVLFIFLASYSFADQLAYISKDDADKAVLMISELKTHYLFCGCCSMEKPMKVEPKKVFARHTGYEDYYEVVIEYITPEGNKVEEAIDLAYTWAKKLGKYATIGKLLELNHDHCVKPQHWNNPKKNKV